MRRLTVLASMALCLAPLEASARQGDASATPAAAAPAARPPRAGRSDLAAAYLRLETAFFAAPVEDERCADINRSFDRASFAFFSGQYAEAVRSLNGAIDTLRPDAPGAWSDSVARSVRVRAEPPVGVGESSRRVTIRVDSLYPVAFEGNSPLPTLELRLVPRAGGVGAARPLALAAKAGMVELSEQVEFELDAAPASPAGYDVRVVGPGVVEVSVGVYYATPASFESQRVANSEAVRAAPGDTPERRRAIAIFRARNELLTDTPSAAASSEFLTDLAALAGSLAAERDEIVAGRNPYRGRAGDLWRVVPATADAPEGDSGLPVRVYAPAAAPDGAPLPLLIAVHGAGGDENMFFEGYGRGIIKQLAETHGVIVVAPRAGPFSATPAFFDRLVEDAAADYTIDRSRVYVLGHSMGGGIVSAWAKARAAKIAAACTIAGVGGFSGDADIPPVLVIAAELDGLIPATRIRVASAKAATAGLPVEYREFKHYGHTLVVGAALPGAIEWLLGRTREQ